jgi:Dyp-type peroxidase family
VPGDDREEHAGKRDLGRNGSYLVFRQLAQDVKGFWEFFRQATGDGEDADSTACIHLAAKMVGRWPSGAPVTKAPERDDPALGNDNDFGYHERDAAGLKCPIGAHIRRTNPRDSLEPDPGSEKSVEFADRHRILRRGRAYGDPVVESMQPEEIMQSDAAGERGLHFICLNANISRQFEFVQQTWTNNPRFDGLYDDPDPIVGPGGKFTEQATPVRRRIHDVPRFVTVRGGAYFFLPGLRALRYLAALQGRGA